MKKWIAVAGNIGVGKSSLVTLLAKSLGWEPFFEPQEDNPYLSDFYRDMSAWGFHSQLFFLTRRLRIHQQLINHPSCAIQDGSVYEDAEIFAHNLHLQNCISARDYGSYRDLYLVLTEFLPPPTWLSICAPQSIPCLAESHIVAGTTNGISSLTT